MPSPFPGMNPYLEAIWHDFHERFLPAAAAYLVPQIRPKYFVSIDENVYLHDVPHDEQKPLGRPDLALIRGQVATYRSSSVGLLEAPAHVLLPDQDVESLSYLTIIDRQSRDVVTVIELLSPTNKRPGEHRAQYLAKRSAIRHSDVHLVEIDLSRGGPPMPAEVRPSYTYAVLVSRADQRPTANFWPFGLRDPLPTILVPLRPGDSDARLDLRSILDRVYDESAYEDYIYQSPPDPPLSPDDTTWARALLPRPVG
jgi:Protein of unknown function (DUF4058)